MFVFLPFLIVALAVSVVACCLTEASGLLLFLLFWGVFLLSLIGAAVLFLLILWIISLFIDQKKQQPVPNRFCNLITIYVMGLLTYGSNIRLHVSGEELLPEGRWLLVCNHRSSYDPIVTGWALRKHGLAFISKPQNLQIPIVGNIIHKAGYLPIDRENDRAALRTILTAADRLKEGVVSYGVYPEGTRNSEQEMLPFRNGAFKIAQKAGVPIVIARIRGTDQVKLKFPWRRSDVYLEICEVMNEETVKQMKTAEIGDKVRACILSNGFCANALD